MSHESCPPDILLLISSYLNPKSKRQLCLVSKYFHSIFAPLVLQNVRISLSGENPDEHLKTCSSHLPNLHRYAESLRVRTSGYSISSGHLTESLLPALWETLARLTSLKSLELEWEGDMAVIMEYQDRIVEGVLQATGHHLERLVLKPGHASQTFPAALRQVRGLRFLRVVQDEFGWDCSGGREGSGETCGCHHPWMKNAVKPLISANLGLETLEIVMGCRKRGTDLEGILPASLTSLTSLTISGLEFSSTGTEETAFVESPLRNLRHLTVRASSKDFGLDPFWNALRMAKPPLESLVSYQVCPSMVNYLVSFSGLRSIEIQGLEADPSCRSSKVVSRFLEHALPHHAESLERLAIHYEMKVYSIPGWDFDPNSWTAALSRLTKLEYLAIYPAVHPDDSDSTTAEELLTAYRTVLEGVNNLPRLKTLKINHPIEPNVRGYICGFAIMHWRSEVRNKLIEVVERLRVNGGKPGELDLFHGTQRCVKLEGDSDDWGYVPVEVPVVDGESSDEED